MLQSLVSKPNLNLPYLLRHHQNRLANGIPKVCELYGLSDDPNPSITVYPVFQCGCANIKNNKYKEALCKLLDYPLVQESNSDFCDIAKCYQQYYECKKRVRSAIQVPMTTISTYETFSALVSSFPHLQTCIARFSASTSTYKRSFGYPTYETFFGSLVTVPRYSYRNVQTFLSFSTPTKHEKCSSVLYPPTKTQKVFLGFADGKTYIALEELRVFYDSNYIKYCM